MASRKLWITLALAALLCAAPLAKAHSHDHDHSHDDEGGVVFEDAEEVDEAVEFIEPTVAPVAATGGDPEDFFAALKAAAQALSKGDFEPARALAAKYFAVAQEHAKVYYAKALAYVEEVKSKIQKKDEL